MLSVALGKAFRTALAGRCEARPELVDAELDLEIHVPALPADGNVALVKTDVFWDLEADAVFKKGWRQNLQEWNKVGSDYPYHYLGSAKTVLGIGRAFGDAVLELRGEAK